MKKIILSIVSLVLILTPITHAEAAIFNSKDNHYSFNIPVGWVEIPQSTIDSTMQKVAEQSKQDKISYSSGFQLAGVPDFQYPYILTQDFKVDTPSYKQIQAYVNGDMASESISQAEKNYSELMSNATSESPVLDKSRNIIFMNFEMDVANVGRVKGLTAMFLGEESVISMNFYSVKSDYSNNLPLFNKFIDSFKYDKGYEYNEIVASKNDSSNLWDSFIKGGAQGAVFGGIGGGIAALIIALIARSIKKKK